MTMLMLLVTLGVASVVYGASPTPTLAGDRDITAAAPLERAKPDFLDKAKGIGPRFKFYSAPTQLSLSCALSIRARVNEGDFVGHPNARAMQEFRSEVAGIAQLNPSEAQRAPIHTAFALDGEGAISSAMCGNTKAGAEARGNCSGTISGSDFTIVYNFDPVPCLYDNVAVAKALGARLSISSRNDREPERDCATKLEGFITEIDDLLGKHPNRMNDVNAVLNRHFPLHGCKVEVVSSIVKKSKYFRSEGMAGLKMHVFSLNSETASTPGVLVNFGLTDTGHSSLPSAIWSPPFP